MGQPSYAPTKGEHAGEDANPAEASERVLHTYVGRKLAGWCTYSMACPRRAEGWPDPAVLMCSYHRSRRNARKRRAQNAARGENVAQGKCRRCRKPSATYRCAACKILDGAVLPTKGEHAGEDANGKDPWRRDANGWERYRGKGRRGAPAAIVNDEADLKTAAEAFERGRISLIYAHQLDIKAGKLGKKDALAAAASILRMAAVFIADVVERNSGERPVLAKKLRQAVEDEGEDYGLEDEG